MKFNFEPTAIYTLEDIYNQASSLSEYTKHLNEVAKQNDYSYDESSINLAFDEDSFDTVDNLVKKKVSQQLKYIFVVGIGGSNLGTKAVYDALYGYRDLLPEDRPIIIFVDTVDESQLRFYVDKLIPTFDDVNEYLLVTISKSGGTTETLVNTEILLTALKAKFGEDKTRERTVVITDEGSDFWHTAKEAGIDHLSIPKLVGGRYSVMSAVGMFPLLALGLDVKSWREGAREMRTKCLSDEVKDNPALLSASVMYKSLVAGKTINDTFIFNSELESLGKWYRQLLGESVGKEYDLSGERVNTGITPTVSIGSTDLHSVGQLYLGGPKDKLTTFVYSFKNDDMLAVSADRSFPNVVEMVNGKTTSGVMKAILDGTKIAYQKNQLPFMEIELEDLSAYEIGAFMQFKMIEMMYLGRLLNVNPFDQPNVESYKTETKKILEV